MKRILITETEDKGFTKITDVLGNIDLLLCARGLELLIGENEEGVYYLGIIMDISGIDNKVIVQISDETDKEEAIKMAIETVCMIKENDIDIEEVII